MASVIDPSRFDLIVVGTGLPQCIVAAAAASCGHSVLHIDPCDFYGSHWASLSLSDFSHWIASSGDLPFNRSSHVTFSPGEVKRMENAAAVQSSGVRSEVGTSGSQILPSEQTQGNFPDFLINNTTEDGQGSFNFEGLDSDIEALGLETLPLKNESTMYSDFCCMGTFGDDTSSSRTYNIDIGGPKLALCGGPLVDLLIRSGASNYLEFKALEGSYLWTSDGLMPVPSSREDIFTNQTLSLIEKRYLMRFFKLVTSYASSEGELEPKNTDLDCPFVEFLRRQQLPASVQATVLYAIALANNEQEQDLNSFGHIINTREGLSSLSLYLTSVKRFQNAMGAFIYPLYGQGELPQAFSRSAAVKGALYVLRISVDAVLRDKKSGSFQGIKISSGQSIFSPKLLAEPLLYTTLRESIGNANGGVHVQCGINRRVARGICLTDKSLIPDMSTVMVTFPPQSVISEAKAVIRALQVGSGSVVCPEGKFLVQLSMSCLNTTGGVSVLQEAIKRLFNCMKLDNDLVEDAEARECGNENRPNLLWAVLFTQHMGFPDGMEWILEGSVGVCDMPDETLDFQSIVASTNELFENFFPGEPFFPRSEDAKLDVEEEDGCGTDNGAQLADDADHTPHVPNSPV